jgi:hypothetical protein
MLGQVRLYEGELPGVPEPPAHNHADLCYADVLSPPVPKAWLVGEENVAEQNNHVHRSPETLTSPLAGDQPTSILDDEEFVTDAPVVSEEEFESYVRERKRYEFEDSFGGVPLWDISVFVIGMWRLDA